ncbi:ABC transporter permease [Desulfofalx alkaliphila]|uniref:ABC transporter permease n=1 Tax=Desulfofalx alkaliphila TaxID=105483 RepID=UPI0004E0D62E|nr:ABC transporter permease [Desulfofalx alkaliphila]
METTTIITICTAAITAGTPLLFAALGEIFTERSGIINLGVEGMMLVGAVTGFMVAFLTANPWLGVMAAMFAGGLLALIHAALTVTLRANQVVTGLALTIFGTGLSGYLGKAYIGQPLVSSFKSVKIAFLSDIPIVGPIFFNHDPLVYLSFILVPLAWYYIYRTRMGLNLRAVGENPGSADSLGVSVSFTRYLYTVVGGMLAGVGGAYLSLAYAPSWMENMTAGRGWIAVALVIFAAWNPLYAMLGAYMFGGIDALGFRMQLMDVQVSAYFLSMLPYLCTILVLIIATRRSQTGGVGAPRALGVYYDREER